MKITALEGYGLRCLLALAKQGSNKQLSISEIAEMEGLSIPYASKLLSILRKADLVAAVRGRGGGFSLTRTPDRIDLHEVLTALGGPMVHPDHCRKASDRTGQCTDIGNCSVHQVVEWLTSSVRALLSRTTLQDLIDGGRQDLIDLSTAPAAQRFAPDNIGMAEKHHPPRRTPATPNNTVKMRQT